MAIKYDKNPLSGSLHEFGSVKLLKVDETKWEVLWDEIVMEYHYLGYEGQVGARIKYIITLDKQIVGAISFCTGAYKLGPRDVYIGWDAETRLKNLKHILSNNRFLILPWINVKNLASHVLAKALVQVQKDWERQYGISPYIVETFIDKGKYLGTCYIASNWTYLGETKGYSRQGDEYVYHGNKKDIYVYVLSKSFAKEFQPDLRRLNTVREELEEMINGMPLWSRTILNDIGITGDFTEQIKQLFLAHIERYIEYVGSKENRAHFVSMEKGLLSDLKRKSAEPIAIAFQGREQARNTMNFLSANKWEDKEMHEEYRKEVSEVLVCEGGMITVDGTDFPKKGNNSVGVSRQYCGRLGKVDNCQASVMTGYVSPKGYGLIDYELYMPERWFDSDHEDRREKCKVPSSIEFKTKNELALEQITRAYESGLFPAKYFGADSSFGSDSVLLSSLPEGLIYFVDIRSNHLVFIEQPTLAVPSYSGKGRKPIKEVADISPRAVKEIAEDNSIAWNDVVLSIGAKGPIITGDKCLRVTNSNSALPSNEVWLYIRKMSDGSIKYAICNESSEASIEDLRRPALMRWSIEQCFNECKDYLGMDHYEVRSWKGWHRHILLCHIAHLFIVKLRMEFSYDQQSPGIAPYIDEAVPLDDYLDATMNMLMGEEILSSKILRIANKPHQVLTIGLIQKLIVSTFPRIGEVLKDIDFLLLSSAKAFRSHTKSTLEKAFENHRGFIPDFG